MVFFNVSNVSNHFDDRRETCGYLFCMNQDEAVRAQDLVAIKFGIECFQFASEVPKHQVKSFQLVFDLQEDPRLKFLGYCRQIVVGITTVHKSPNDRGFADSFITEDEYSEGLVSMNSFLVGSVAYENRMPEIT